MLLVLIVPPCLYYTDRMSLDRVKDIMLAATVVWFITAGVWMWKNDPA